MRTFFLLFLVSIIAQAQNATTYVNHRNEKHLCGVLNYKSWKKTVFIPLGITTIIIALYDSKEKYKQGPNGEEKGKNIRRVPTFIFKEKGEEFARIVESPRNDLLTDLKQIATGTASKPNYHAVSYFLDLFDQVETKEVNKNIREHYNAIYGLACKSRELNTLGHVYLSAGKIDEAILVFYLNTYLFRYEPNVYLNYGIALEANDELEKAKENFSKALELEPEYELAKEKLAGLEEN